MDIIHGSDTSLAEHPWLLRMSTEKGSCGASLIGVSYMKDASDIVLTAGHCVGGPEEQCMNEKSEFQKIEVTIVKETGTKSMKVIDGKCHENWNPKTIVDDIAILKLATPIKFTKTMHPIELPKRGAKLKAGTECTVAGWGGTGFSTPGELKSMVFPTKLQQLKVKIMNDSECSQLESIYDPQRMVCETAASGRGHACNGDSGGALMCKRGKHHDVPVIEGIVSFGNVQCVKENVLAVLHTKVEKYLDWIERQVTKLHSK